MFLKRFLKLPKSVPGSDVPERGVRGPLWNSTDWAEEPWELAMPGSVLPPSVREC